MITIKSYLKITIKNSCSENVFLQNPHLETKKSDRSYHGFGLKIVQKITKSYHGTLRTEQIDGFFVATVLLRFASSSTSRLKQ